MMDSPTKEPSRRARRSRIPLPSLQPAERIRGADILEEHPPHPALVLWESYRNVGDWAVTPRSERARYSVPLGAIERRNEDLSVGWMDPDLRAALEVIRDMMAEPRRTQERLVARACGQISAWAAKQGALATQFYFAAAAGLCLPEDARQAYHVGCLARSLAKWDAAEVWLEHAMFAARRKGDREAQGMAILGLGNTYYRQGLYPRAKEAYTLAFTLAGKHRLPEIKGGALHDLFVISAELEEYAHAEEYARLALHAYGKENPRITGLAHDVAFFWLSRGQGTRALPVLEALLPHLLPPAHRIHALGSIAHAAGLCGKAEVFERRWKGVWVTKDEPEAQPRLAPALLELAYGAASLKEQAKAVEAARSALELAEQRGEMDVVERGRALLLSLERGEMLNECIHATEGSRDADQLAEELVEALQA